MQGHLLHTAAVPETRVNQLVAQIMSLYEDDCVCVKCPELTACHWSPNECWDLIVICKTMTWPHLWLLYTSLRFCLNTVAAVLIKLYKKTTRPWLVAWITSQKLIPPLSGSIHEVLITPDQPAGRPSSFFLCLSCREEPTMPGLLLGDEFPNFEADTTIGRIKFHDFLGSSWGILFSHPKDFTPVCTTELARAAKLSEEFKKRDVKMIALSIDSVEDHRNWSKDVMAVSGAAETPLPYPIIADDKRELSVKLGMLDPDERDKAGMPLTARCVFVIGPDKKLKLSILYPATTGRNFDELLRVIDSLQLTAQKKVATPVDWKPGDKVMVIPTLSEAEASALFPNGVTTKEVPSGKSYLRYTQP